MQADRIVAERRRKQTKRRTYFWAVAGFLVVYFAAFTIFYFIVRSPAFRVEKITIQGTNEVPTSTVMDILETSIIRQGNTLTGRESGMKAMLGFDNMLIWPKAIPSSTFAVVPQLAGITISKNYFLHTITVTVTERVPYAVWCVMPADDCFWFDNHGIAFANTLDTEGGAITVIHDYSKDSVALDGSVLPVEFMPALISIVNTIKTSGLNVQQIALNDLSLEQINVTTLNGPAVYFSLRFSADEDLGVLESLMAQPGFDKLQYIDFTVQNRAFYK